MENELYRIISFENFITICLLKKERFVNPITCWEDTFEGFYLHKLDSENGNKEIIDYLYNSLFNQDPYVTINNLAKLQRARFSCYGQSWSKEPDSDALWRIYSYNKKGIQMISDRNRILDLINSNHIDGLICRIGKVDYGLDFTSNNSINKVLYKGSKTDEPFFHKRAAFEHEKEVRVMLQLTKQYLNYTIFTAGIMEKYYNKYRETRRDEDIILDAAKLAMNTNFKGFYVVFPENIKIDIYDLSSYIKGIKVHPQAEKWYVDLVRDICDKSNVPFLGKSKLYDNI